MKVSQLLLNTKKFNPKAMLSVKSTKKPTFRFKSFISRDDDFREFKMLVVTYDTKTLKPTSYNLHFMMKDLGPLEIEFERFGDSDSSSDKFLNSGEYATLYAYLNNRDFFIAQAIKGTK